MSDVQTLRALAAKVEVMDVAGEIIARPRHARVSTIQQLALALAFEQAWAIVLEANVLVHLLDRGLPCTGALPYSEADQQHRRAIEDQAALIRKLLAPMRQPQPKTEGEA